MTETHDGDSGLEELLPWYVNGSLSEDEDSRVRRLIEEDTGAAQGIEFLRQIREVVQSQQIGSPGELGLRRLRAAVAVERVRESPAGKRGRRWRWPVTAAAALVILVQGAMLMNAWQRPPAYRPAGSSPQRPVIQLQFAPGATEQQISDLLTRLDLEIVGGPGGVGVYRVAPVREGADLGKLVIGLRKAGNIVSFAEVE